jgi:hypothetical protein
LRSLILGVFIVPLPSREAFFMSNLQANNIVGAPIQLPEFKKKLSLSSYFPAGTYYFYGYPAGEASGFLNNVPPAVEELVAARAFSCAGPRVSVVSFAATASPALDEELLHELSIPQLRSRQITLLPQEIDDRLKGAARNESVKAALKDLVPDGSLVMAQPDADMAGLYQIPPALTSLLNDKQHMGDYIATDLLPTRYATYKNGAMRG